MQSTDSEYESPYLVVCHITYMYKNNEKYNSNIKVMYNITI